MVRRLSALILGILLLLVFLFNSYLLISLVDGARIVREAETRAGHSLNCFDLYATKSITDYFYPDRALQGDTIYLTGILFPVWIGVSIGVPLALMLVLGKQKLWHWFPVVLMAPLLLAIGIHFRSLSKLVCALE